MTQQMGKPLAQARGEVKTTLHRARTMMGPDKQGKFYIGNQAQGGVVVFDPSTEKFEFHDPPGGGEMLDVSASQVDGNGWRSGGGGAIANAVPFEHTFNAPGTFAYHCDVHGCTMAGTVTVNP